MAAPGAHYGSLWGLNEMARIAITSGVATFAMAGLNSGWCARFTARDARDIKSVYLDWSAITAAGTVQLRVETIDATTGKPSGSLYDAAAVKSFTPTLNRQTVTFDVLPTAGLTAGTEYGIVLLTTTGGTTQTLRSSTAFGSYPTVALTAADGTTRSNFAEVTSGTPILALVFDDDVEEAGAFMPFYSSLGASAIFGTAAAGLKFTIPTGVTISAAGIELAHLTRVSTPPGDLRVRVFNSADATVAGTTFTLDKDSLTGVNARRLRLLFPSPVSLTAGTYRIVLDSAASDGSNFWRITTALSRSAAILPSGFCYTSTADLTAGPIVWTDTATEMPTFGLIVDTLSAAAAGGLIVNRGMDGGMT